MPKRPTHSVAIVVYDGLCTFEFGCAVEIFCLSRPEVVDPWYDCVIAAADDGPIRGLGRLRVEADGGLELLQAAETIVIPGWRGPLAPVPSTLITALRQAHSKGARIISICAGAFVLGEAGLLAGKRATTHWHHIDALRSRFPNIDVVADVLYVDEGSVMTSAGSAAGLDLCLHVVRCDFGAKAANQVARRLVLPTHREGGQAQFIERPVALRASSRLSAVQDTIRTSLSEAWTIERMAREAGHSIRSLHRHFQTATGLAPGAWLNSERVARACELLEETALSVDLVAQAVGFGSAPTLRSHFRSSLGISPTRYRRQFGARTC